MSAFRLVPMLSDNANNSVVYSTRTGVCDYTIYIDPVADEDELFDEVAKLVGAGCPRSWTLTAVDSDIDGRIAFLLEYTPTTVVGP